MWTLSRFVIQPSQICGAARPLQSPIILFVFRIIPTCIYPHIHPFMYFLSLSDPESGKAAKPFWLKQVYWHSKTKFPTSQVIDNYCGFVWGGKVDGRVLLCGTVYWTLILFLLVWIYAVCCLASHDNTISFKNQEITEFHTKTNFTDIIHASLRSIIGKHTFSLLCRCYPALSIHKAKWHTPVS